MARIIHAAHPLHGCHVPIRQVLRKGGEVHLLIDRPDGDVQLIPQRWTDRALQVQATPGARFTPKQLLTLRRWLDERQPLAGFDKDRVGGIVSGVKTNILGDDAHEQESLSSQSRSSVVSTDRAATASVAVSADEMGATGPTGTAEQPSDACIPGRQP